VLKSFVASKETIKEMVITKDLIIVAGCEPIIRAYNLETGKSKTFMGHKGWVYCLMAHQHMLFSGGDDNTVRVWDLNTTHQLECLTAHRNGVTAIALCNGDLYTASFDHYLMHWDFSALMARLEEMAMMRKEDVLSRKVEAYYRIVAEKNKKKAKDTKKRR
jgi:WD40 repeat protein